MGRDPSFGLQELLETSSTQSCHTFTSNCKLAIMVRKVMTSPLELGEQMDEKMDLIKKQTGLVTFLFTGCRIQSSDDGSSPPQINHLHQQLLSHQWAGPLPQNCSDELPSETNPSNLENGEIPAGSKRRR